MKPHYNDDRVTLYHGDCIEVMRSLPDASVDAVVTDPPYGLEFMGKDWDAPWKVSGDVEVALEGTDVSHPFRDGTQRVRYGMADMPGFQSWCTEWATQALRILKPGGHLLAFGGTRTWHRLASAIEDAGFEVRDSIAWMYGSGFPKSHDVSKGIDKAAGAQREVVGVGNGGLHHKATVTNLANWDVDHGADGHPITAPATPAALQWQGWGTALKPAFEPIVVARKPLIGTVAENVLAHGTGALNIEGCRIGFASAADEAESKTKNRHADFGTDSGGNAVYGDYSMIARSNYNPPGRWPANVILDESQAAALDKQSGNRPSKGGTTAGWAAQYVGGTYDPIEKTAYNDSGGASRFFYVAKAGKKERPNVNGVAHPTVKPMALMQYLVRLVTPPGGTVLEPFAGSGTTIEAALNEGFNVIGIEMTDEYLPLIMSRIERYGDKLC
jgi:site-specific DNA-methyltransferase (adenine-specific)